MATINSTIKMTDKASGTLNTVNNALNGTKNKMSLVNSETVDMGSKGIGTFERWERKVISFNQGLELAQKAMAAIKGVANFTDNLTMNQAKLNLMNDGLQTTKELQDMIYESANRSRGSYDEMTKSVAKMGMLAKDAFKNNKEIIAFNETLNKAFTISGAGEQEKSSAMYQLTQSMASGALQGDELRTIREAAPMLYDAIAKYMGKSKGELKELGAEGKITSDIIKNAMFSAADDINAKFNEVPITFEQAGTKIKNAWQYAMQDVSNRLNKAFNSEGFQKFIQFIINGIGWLGGIIGPFISFIISAIGALTSFISNNWEIIRGILIVLAIMLIPQLIVVLSTLIGKMIMLGIQALISGAKMFIGWMMALGPIGLIIMAIIAVMAILKMLGVSFETIFGVIGGILGAFVAFVFNFVILPIWNKFASFANFLANVFNDPVYSIKKLFVDLLNTVLDIVNSVAKVIDKVLGTNWSSSIKGFQKDMKDWLGESDKYKEYVPMLEAMDYEGAWNKGKSIGGSIGKGLDKLISDATSMFDGLNANPAADKYNIDDIINNGAMSTYVEGGSLDDVNISDEDLKMLKDIATREYMLNYKRITPNVKIEFGDVHETADVDGVMNKVKTMMEEELAELYVVEEA